MTKDLSNMGEEERLLYLANLKDSVTLTSGGHLVSEKSSMVDMVRQFHEKHGIPAREDRELQVDPERAQLRYNLLFEEFSEVLDEAKKVTLDSLPNLAKELADAIYVILGTALEFGIPMDDVFKEVHKSNMTKGVSEKRGDGKVLKGEDYVPADVASVIQNPS